MLFIKYIDNILKIRIINIILNPQDELNLILKFELSIVSNVYLKDSQLLHYLMENQHLIY